VPTTQPQWRYVPFASTLLICSGLFMLLHGASQEPVRPIGHGMTCEGVSAPGMPQSLSRTPGGEDLDSPDTRSDDAHPFITPSVQAPVDVDPLEQTSDLDSTPWASLRYTALWLRGPPTDSDNQTHRWSTGLVDSSFDATDDDDDGDDDADTDDGDGLATDVVRPVDASCALHASSLLSRVEVHSPVSFTSDVQSLRAPPQ
jgi:hypothetical protein